MINKKDSGRRALAKSLRGKYQRKTILFIVFMLVSLHSIAQCNISGIVNLSDGTGIWGANVFVSLKSSPKTIIGSTFTAEDGSFSLNLNTDNNSDSLILEVSGIEIASKQITIPNRSGSYNIIVENRTMKLKEVVVKAKKIYSQGDTINYSVNSYLSRSDQSVADVLRKMPGITISEAGQVFYQGKPIKNFYIEGLDLMKDHYGIATNNIDPNNIATVQVLEHHQDIKALKGLRPEERASINLRLKEGVKGVFNVIATIGGGYNDAALWNNSAIVTYFRRNSQYLATYKGNNTGEDLSQELYSFDDNDYSRTNNISSITMPSAPGIDHRFYYFNRSHSATYNSVYRVGNSGDFGINVAYLNDRDNRKSSSTTANTLPDGSQNIVDEQMNGVAHTQKAYGDLTYMNNSEQNYLKEQLKFDWSKTKANSSILADDEDINQQGNTDIFRLLNKFHMIHRNSDSRGFEVSSLLNVEKRPHSLSVSPNLFPDLFEGDLLSQNVDYRNISTENKFAFLSAFKYRNFSLHPTAIINFSHNSLESRLEHFNNNLALNYLDAGIGAEFVYDIRKLHLSLLIPMKYKLFNLDRRSDAGVTNKNRFRLEPNLNISYNINSSHHLSVESALNYMIPSVENLYSNYILTSYRCLSVFDVAGLYEGTNLYNNLSYNFKNILSMSFAGFDLTWQRQSPEILFGSYYDGIVQRTISQRTSETGDIISAKIHASQGFDWRHLKIGASISYSYYDSPLLVQNQTVRYTCNSIGVDANISLSPFSWLESSWEGNYYQTASRQKGYAPTQWLRTVVNKASLEFTIPGGVTIKTSVYHYYNNFNEGDKSFVLLNAEARYSIKRISFSLACDNLLNSKTYLYSSQAALTESRSAYEIRHRSVLFKIRYRVF